MCSVIINTMVWRLVMVANWVVQRASHLIGKIVFLLTNREGGREGGEREGQGKGDCDECERKKKGWEKH